MEQSDWSECYNHGTSTMQCFVTIVLFFSVSIHCMVPWLSSSGWFNVRLTLSGNRGSSFTERYNEPIRDDLPDPIGPMKTMSARKHQLSQGMIINAPSDIPVIYVKNITGTFPSKYIITISKYTREYANVRIHVHRMI